MSSLPGLTLEAFVAWQWNLVVQDQPENNFSLGVAEYLGVQTHRPTEGPYTPRIVLNPEVKDIFDFTIDDIQVVDYHPQPAIKYPAAAV